MIGKDLPYQTPGRPITPRTINRFAQLVADLSRGQTLAGSGIGLDRRGRRERRFHARLSGSTSPYDFEEVYGSMSGSALTWVTLPRGRTGTGAAYEDNGASGLNGKVAWLEPAIGTAGVWRFGFNRKGPPPPCETGRICVTVQSTGCSFDLTGVTVTVTDSDGAVIDSGPTSGSPGRFCCDLPVAGRYTVTSHIPGATDQSATIDAICGIDNNATLTYPPNVLGRVCYSFTYCGLDGISIPYPGVVVTVGGSATGTSVPSDSSGNVCFILGNGTYTNAATFPRGAIAQLTGVVVNTCSTTNRSADVMMNCRYSADARYNTGSACSATLRVYDNVLGVTHATGTLTLVPDGFTPHLNYVGSVTLEFFPEIVRGGTITVGNNALLDVTWPSAFWSSTGLTTAYSCFPPTLPLGSYTGTAPCSDPPP